ncbi:glutamine-hydrolyzing carbamoyl-phosphate synthase small subunit [Gulosibacter molinativorax]|uniref:Carbamoyl phosphate synthase small chain n=1 Tax=Gulosibacter molinativorax TaxID=256821 RepID=A0ABT7C8K5_9MICO|nr:glutamine-hydrolyzing carbamoyl-phosphate synthase small subunit [Gulosibacter molinativorax]MDJ1371067.1 carbamoyl-phosphate synthase small subunit [Gulosibacter molinativorax]QUY61427.1 Carbamoyl-phosphate synthase small chain [Gulosibacter molinativorax]
MIRTEPAVLVLEDGTRYDGFAYGATGERLGEVVFTTGMTGYQETLSDPSYAGQIVVQTAPHIGNTGVNAADMESDKFWVAGYVVRDASRVVSNFRAEGDLETALRDGDIVGIRDIDTRALTRRIRNAGAMRGGVFSGEAYGESAEAQLEKVKAQPSMAGQYLSDLVTTNEPYLLKSTTEEPAIGSVALLDLGVKRATPANLNSRGFDVHVLPADATAEQVRALGVDAVFYSNGPGDPEANDAQVDLLRDLLREGYPFMGICFGNQLLGRALGFGTYKLPFGHRGVNQPVRDTATNRVEITSQNHGFAVDLPLDETVDSPEGFGRVEVSHIGLNDQVVEGLRCLDIPAFSVQFHPEAASGPHDAAPLFDRFRDMVLEASAKKSEK